MEKIIKLTGRVDSANAAEFEKRILDEIGAFDGDVVLDAKELKYISSAGLRVILRIKKTFSSTKIVNCNPEMYDIFDMTGFVEMMDISKAYREISVEGCEVIGEGANGIVYRTDPDTIVKVYKNPDSLDVIKNERELARKAFVMGIPTAIPYDVVKVGDLYGSVFELLNAKSFAKLTREGVPVEELAKQSVDILKTIHSTHLKPDELPKKKSEALVWAEFTKDYLEKDNADKLIGLFNDIPETDTMIHGDFHIKNIMQQNGENLLIDMDTLSMGHPIFEFAAIFAAYIGYSCVDENNGAEFLGIEREQCRQFWDYTIKYYFEGKDEAFLNDIETKASIICYTRIVRWMARKFSADNEYAQQVISFCKDYLNENIPKTENLYF